MAEDDTLPEPDRAEGALHPRETPVIHGQQDAMAQFLAAHAAGRLHSGWLITGPQGIGKATLAYQIAGHLLSTPAPGGGLFAADPGPMPYASPADLALLRAGSHPRLCIIRRGHDDKGKPRSQITVDEVRRLRGFFQLSAADGGHRVVIVDPADDLNPNAANAILKLLEEPPAGAVLLLISHQPSRLLPTIRSRCRTLRCATLGAADLAAALAQQGVASEATEALAELAAGSVGQAIRLVNMDGLEIYADLVRLLSDLPRLDRPAAIRLAESCIGKNSEPRFSHLLDLLDLFLSRAARAGLFGEPPVQGAPGESRLLARLSPHDAAARAWAALQQDLSTRVRHGKAVNLDPSSLILDMLWRIEDTARTTTTAAA
jgi:DNA polymerase-3 subunit delta'